MFTRKALNEKISGFLSEIESVGFKVSKAVLFGSYVKGKIHEYSDIDLAIWLSNFPEKHWSEIPAIVHLTGKYSPISTKFYPENEIENEYPFIGVIEKQERSLIRKK